MLSTTTTALSTSMPTASSRPIIDRMFNVMPNICRQPERDHEADRNRQRHHQRRRPVAQEEEQHEDRQQRAFESRLAELAQAFGDRLGLIAERVDLDALHLGFLADPFDFGHHVAADLDQIGAAFLRDVDRDRRALV